jgi:hypothetical protein
MLRCWRVQAQMRIVNRELKRMSRVPRVFAESMKWPVMFG